MGREGGRDGSKYSTPNGEHLQGSRTALWLAHSIASLQVGDKRFIGWPEVDIGVGGVACRMDCV